MITLDTCNWWAFDLSVVDWSRRYMVLYCDIHSMVHYSYICSIQAAIQLITWSYVLASSTALLSSHCMLIVFIVSCSFLITHLYTTFLQQSSFNQLSCFLYILSHPVIVLLLSQLVVGITPCPCWKTPKTIHFLILLLAFIPSFQWSLQTLSLPLVIQIQQLLRWYTLYTFIQSSKRLISNAHCIHWSLLEIYLSVADEIKLCTCIRVEREKGDGGDDGLQVVDMWCVLLIYANACHFQMLSRTSTKMPFWHQEVHRSRLSNGTDNDKAWIREGYLDHDQ